MDRKKILLSLNGKVCNTKVITGNLICKINGRISIGSGFFIVKDNTNSGKENLIKFPFNRIDNIKPFEKRGIVYKIVIKSGDLKIIIDCNLELK